MAFKNLKDYKQTEVNLYIKGYDLNNVDELENDPKFMTAVIASPESNSKMYRFCSDRVKADYDFIDTFMTLYYDAADIIIEAAYTYIRLNESEDVYNEHTTEIAVRACDYLLRNKEYLRNNPKAIDPFYKRTKKEYEYVRNDFKEKNPNSKTMGFSYICTKYNGNSHIVFYMANELLSELFDSEEVKKKFELIFDSKTYENNNETITINRELSESEKIALCIRVLYSYDSDLVTYLSNNYVVYRSVTERIKNEMKNYNLNNHTLSKNLTLDSKKVVD